MLDVKNGVPVVRDTVEVGSSKIIFEQEKERPDPTEALDPPTEESSPDQKPLVQRTAELVKDPSQLAAEIVEAPDVKTLQQCLDIFNLNQSKKNALRALKLNELLDAVENQAIERFKKRPDQISNKELLDYMQVVSSQVERSQKAAVEQLNTKPAIQINQQKNEVNVNVGGTSIDRDSKERILEAVQALLQQAQSDSAKGSFENSDCIISEETEEPIEVSAETPEEASNQND